MNPLSPEESAAEVALQMKKQLGVGGSGLEAKLKRAGRKLPRHVRKDAEFLAKTARLSVKPKLQNVVDRNHVEKARDNCLKYLKSVDQKRRRTDVLLGVLSGVALGVLIPVGLFTTVLVWRGYL